MLMLFYILSLRNSESLQLCKRDKGWHLAHQHSLLLAFTTRSGGDFCSNIPRANPLKSAKSNRQSHIRMAPSGYSRVPQEVTINVAKRQ